METVVKVGGSTIRDRERCRKVVNALEDIESNISVIAGGGEAADVVRELDERFSISDEAAHWAAIKAMDVNAHVLSGMSPVFQYAEDEDEIRETMSKDHIPVTGVYQLLRKDDSLDKSWDVTSDSITAHLGKKFGVEKIVLVKSVSGIKDDEGKLHQEITAEEAKKSAGEVIDPILPEILQQHQLSCTLVHGEYPERVKSAIEGERTTATQILSK